MSSRLPWHWPVWCPFLPSDASLFDRSDHVFSMIADVDGPPADVLDALWNNSLKGGIPFYTGMIWESPKDVLEALHVLECFTFMTLDLQGVDYTPDRELVVSVNGATMPLAEQMVERCEARPRDGRTHFVWQIAVLYPWWMKPMAPTVEPFFQWMFDRSLAALVAAYHRDRVGTRAGAAASA